jgi:predicted nucleic acid-binding protein
VILDTNAVSALAAKEPAILGQLDEAEELSVSFIAMAEFQFGLLGSKRPEAGYAMLQQLATMVPVLYPDADTLAHYAWVADHLKRMGRPIPHNDMWTAALARQHSLAVLSRDRHFDYVDGIVRRDW